jgi:hypothetical protein
MHTGGELTVHANVVFEANTGTHGGAVSLRFDTVQALSVVVFGDKCHHGCFDLMRHLIEPRLMGSLLSSNHVYHS